MNLAFLILFWMTGANTKFSPPLTRLRTLYQQAAVSQDSLRSLKNLVGNFEPGEQPVLLCYKGVSFMLEARYAFNPFAKLKSFYAGKALIERAVKRDSINVEIRLLRYGVQYNIPAFLRYNANEGEDRAFLEHAIASVKDVELKTIISNTLKLLKQKI